MTILSAFDIFIFTIFNKYHLYVPDAYIFNIGVLSTFCFKLYNKYYRQFNLECSEQRTFSPTDAELALFSYLIATNLVVIRCPPLSLPSTALARKS